MKNIIFMMMMMMMMMMVVVVVVVGMLIAAGFPASAHELSGYAAGEFRGFLHDARYGHQEENNFSLALQPEYYHQWENGNAFNFIPFARVVQVSRCAADSRRLPFH